MAREITTYPETRDDWRRLIPPLEANAPDLPHMEVPRLQLVGIIDQVSDLLTQQSVLTANKQEVSKKLQVLIVEGRRLAAFIRAGVRQKYGPRSEKLAEFNVQPFRGRKTAEEKGKKGTRGKKGSEPSAAANPTSE